jgi:hypothetical protein
MNDITFIDRAYGVAGPFLLLAAFLLPLCSARRRSAVVRITLTVLCLAVILIPVKRLSLHGYFRGFFWELSVTSSVLLCYVVLQQLMNRRLVTNRELAPIFFLVGAAGLLLYLSVTGVLRLDVYRLGYQPLGLLLALLLLAIVAWICRRRTAALFIIIAVAAFDIRLLNSDNLWDYLLDPLVTLFAWGWMIYRSVRHSQRSSDARGRGEAATSGF